MTLVDPTYHDSEMWMLVEEPSFWINMYETPDGIVRGTFVQRSREEAIREAANVVKHNLRVTRCVYRVRVQYKGTFLTMPTQEANKSYVDGIR